MVLAAAMSVACGGGGGTSTPPTNGGLVASFTPANANPPAQSIAMASGGGSGATFRVDVMVKDVNDFFGAAFPVRFGTGTANFLNHDANGSIIEGAGITLDFRAEPSLNDPSVILVVATRQGAGVTGVNVAGSQKLITLIFEADGATGGNNFSFDDTAGQRVATRCPAGQACVDVPVQWFGGTMTAN
jgi:hypothetical protein